MIPKKAVIIALILLLFISGCSKDDIKLPPKIEYHVGTEGLVLDTLENMPPDRVFQNSEFMIGVEIRNKGAYDVYDGTVIIAGLDPKYMSLEKYQESFEIPGKSQSYPEGGYDMRNFKLKNVDFPDGKETYYAPFTIIGDYGYETEAKVDVCIDPEIYSYVKTEGCEVKDISISKGQGAPLAITLVEPAISMTDEDLDYVDVNLGITIENKGDGEVITEPKIERAYLGNKKIECSEIIKEKKDDDRWYVLCTTEMSNIRKAYTTPLIVAFDYRYRTRMDEKVTIKKLHAEKS